jgi:proline iminopeptidase
MHGHLDISSPVDIAWRLARAWRGSELVVVDDAGHGAGHPSTIAAILDATNRFAGRGR